MNDAPIQPVPFDQRLALDSDRSAALENLQTIRAKKSDLTSALAAARAKPKGQRVPAAVATMVVGLETPGEETYDAQEVQALEARLRDLELAETMQARVIRTATENASLRICREAGEAHRQKLRAVADAVRALQVATREEREMRFSLQNSGVEISGPIDGRPVVPAHITNDDGGWCEKFLEQCEPHLK